MSGIQGILALSWLGCTIAMFYFFIRALSKKGGWRKAGLSMMGGLASVAVAATLDSKTQTNHVQAASHPAAMQSTATQPNSDVQIAQLKAQLLKSENEKHMAEQTTLKAQQDRDNAKAQATLAVKTNNTSGQNTTLKNLPSNSRETSVKRISAEDYFGCIDKDNFNKAVKFAAERDTDAFRQILEEGIISGDCILFKKGQIVHIEGGNLFGSLQVRPEGITSAYWTNIEAVN